MKRVALLLTIVPAQLLLVLGALSLTLQAPRMDVPQKENWVFRNVTLVEAGRQPRPGSTLRIEGGVIAQADGETEATPRALGGPDGKTSNCHPDPSEAADLAGLYVAPGLTDLHVHYPPKIAVGNTELWSLLLLAHGVTSIRETGSIFEVREAIRDGQFPGPRIFACGRMLDGEHPSFPSNLVVATPEAARGAVLDMASKGADCIKAYNMLSADALGAIRETAAEKGLPLIGHSPHSVPFEEAGLIDLQHGTGAVQIDPELIGQWDFRDEDWLTMDADRIAHVARVSLEQDIAHTPTLINSRMRLLLVEGAPMAEAVARDSGLRHLPRYWSMAWQTIWGPPFIPGDDEREASNAMFQAQQTAMTVELHKAGVRIHAGTDTLMPFVAPGSSLHGELSEFVKAGIAGEEVWEIATREAGRSLGLRGLGTLDLGAPAELIFLRSNPHDGIAALSEIEAVLADGRLYRRSDLDAMLAAADAHFLGAFYSGVMDTVAALAQGQFAPDHD